MVLNHINIRNSSDLLQVTLMQMCLPRITPANFVLIFASVILFVMVLFPDGALASTTPANNTEFRALHTKLNDWTNGYLGKIIVLISVVAAGAGMAGRGWSFGQAAGAVGVGGLVGYGPGLITTMTGALI